MALVFSPSGGTGAAGANGNTVLNGSGAPSNGTGANGDFYIDTTNGRMYGPKSAGAWPATYVTVNTVLNELYQSYSEAASVAPGTGTAGNFTVGTRFFLSQNKTILGAKWYAPFAATFKVGIWGTAGTLLTSNDVVVGSAGMQTTTFSSSQALTASTTAYTLTTYDKSGTKYMNASGASNLMPPLNATVRWGPHIFWNGFFYHAGDAFPDTGAGSEIYAIDPIF